MCCKYSEPKIYSDVNIVFKYTATPHSVSFFLEPQIVFFYISVFVRIKQRHTPCIVMIMGRLFFLDRPRLAVSPFFPVLMPGYANHLPAPAP